MNPNTELLPFTFPPSSLWHSRRLSSICLSWTVIDELREPHPPPPLHSSTPPPRPQSLLPSQLITLCAKNTRPHTLTANWVNDAGGLPVMVQTWAPQACRTNSASISPAARLEQRPHNPLARRRALKTIWWHCSSSRSYNSSNSRSSNSSSTYCCCGSLHVPWKFQRYAFILFKNCLGNAASETQQLLLSLQLKSVLREWIKNLAFVNVL